MIFKKIYIPFLGIILALSAQCFASSTRTIDGDAITSSDHTKTWTGPGATGKIMISAGIVSEVPSGTVNSSNVTFTLANTPTVSATVNFYVDGLTWIQGTDYTISGATITATTAPSTGQTVYVVYSKY